MVRNLLGSPSSSTADGGNTAFPPTPASYLSTSPCTRGLQSFPGYPPHHPGHRSSGYVPSSTGPGGSRMASGSSGCGGGLLCGGKKRSHSQSSVNDLDIPSLTRSSQGSLNMLQAMQSSRSGVSSTGGSYGHLSAGEIVFWHLGAFF